jgi:diaminohydroxyphosphoribosylaminopyrimidine deaminase/5-amino-6-(5-phosphoribosylamino)uracil reductase
MSSWNAVDTQMMQRAIDLARNGEGFVEPNPMVGCVIVKEGEVVGEGWHQRFGGPHAEVEALRAAGERARGGTMYVSLEPCCHQGKTPPCTEAIISAGIARVVTAMPDPFPQVSGGGFSRLRDAGIAVEAGLQETEARELNAPYLKLLSTARPWVIAKWAMTLDGKIATRTGDSKWISGSAARQVVHRLRGRVDAIVVGRRTAELDDPLLTARLENEQPRRIATRIVLDSHARLRTDSQLVRTAAKYPTLVVTNEEAPPKGIAELRGACCEVLPFSGKDRQKRLLLLLDELGRRRMTNILVEGGGELLGVLFDARQIDEVHVFLGSKLVGGQDAASPIGGNGLEKMAEALQLASPSIERTGEDLYIHGRLRT